MVGSSRIPGPGLRLRRMLRLEGWTPNGVFHGADATCAFDPERGRQPTPKPLTRYRGPAHHRHHRQAAGAAA
jgi:hypothetical protein